MSQTEEFIGYLEGLREDRAALAALRRGLGQPPGTVADMYRYVVPWLSEDTPRRREAAFYTIAALFAYHPQPGGSDNMGHHFARARGLVGDETAIERRFTVLLSAHPDDLQFGLRQAVSFLKSKEVPVNWQQLLFDILNWGHPDGFVQRQWARGFWGRAPQKPEDKGEKEE
jgi:CRISPR system Cascade subunit CasB